MTHVNSAAKNSPQFRYLGLIGKYAESALLPELRQVLQLAQSLSLSVWLDAETLADYAPTLSAEFVNVDLQLVTKDNLVARADLLILIGGDGSFLGASREAVVNDKPITGINTGRLGFLTDIYPDEITEQLGAILTGELFAEQRSVLTVQIERQQQTICNEIAINDAVLHKHSQLKMVELEVFLDQTFLSLYHADGLIVATPTGSTAYALSAGGPILQSLLDALVIVPISPHTLTQRPIVVSSDVCIRVRVSEHNRSAVSLTLDGQTSFDLQSGDWVIIQRYEKKLQIFHPPNYDSCQRFRDKLGWGNESNS